MRSYANCIIEAFKKTEIIPKINYNIYKLNLSYANYAKIGDILINTIILESIFETEITLKIKIKEDLATSICKQIEDYTSGRANLTFIYNENLDS